MKYATILISYATALIILVSSAGTGRAQTGWKWAAGSGSPHAAFELVTLVNDNQNNLLFTGFASGNDTLVLGTATFYAGYANRSVIAEADTGGNILWVVVSHGSGPSMPVGAVVDTGGNIYVLGTYADSITIGTFSLWAAPTHNMLYLAKVSSAGVVLWAQNVCYENVWRMWSAGARTGYLGLDAQSNVYVCGNFGTSAVTIGATTLMNADVSGISSDIFLAKYNSSGAPLWAERFGNTRNDGTNAMTVTPNGTVYMSCGSNSPLINVGGTTLVPTGTWRDSTDMNFIVKLDTAGHVTWARKINCYIGIGGMIADDSDQFYVSGYTDSTVVLGADTILCPYLYERYLLVKFDSACNALWARSAMYGITTYFPGANSMSIDRNGAIWVTAPALDSELVSGHMLYSPIPGSTHDPMLIAQYTSGGGFLQGMILPSGGDDWGAISTDRCGNFYVGGDYMHTYMPFGTDTLPTYWQEEMYLAKYKFDLLGCDPAPLAAGEVLPPGDQFAIYPNPAGSDITITCDGSMAGAEGKIARVSIMNVEGQNMGLYSFPAGTDKTTLDVSRLPRGVYLARINGTVVKKFMKE